jgi:hypothetical protein
MRTTWICITVALGLAASPASAQTWTERAYVSVNGAFQATTNDFRDRFEFDKDLETGTTEAGYRVKGGFLFDAGGGVRLWKNVGAGAAFSYFTRKDGASTDTQSPHPFFAGRFRAVSGDATGLARTETAVHVQAMYFFDPSGPLRIVFSGGPTFLSVDQEIITEVALAEAYPYDTAEYSSVQTETIRKSAPAFNVGADVLWMLNRSTGVGGIVRFSRASVDLDAPGNRRVAIDAGGLYVGGGLRVLF